MTSIIFRFTVYLSFEKSLEEQDDQMKYIYRKSFLNFNFSQNDCLKSDFAWPNSSKLVLL